MRNPASIPTDELARRLDILGFSLNDGVVANLAAYLGLLMKWNKVINLVGPSSWEKILETLVIDSFHLAGFLRETGLPGSPTSYDIGAGAGIPGIPLRMLWRDGSYTLVETREKRVSFMRTALADMNLGDTRVFSGRAEDFFAGAKPADLVVSRAFMPWRDMLAFIKHALAPGARVLFLASSAAPGDLSPPWELVAQTEYAADGRSRHFWCLTSREKAA